ncbi:MAG: transcriptional regulator [Alphaproteobacteria bacterium]|nr:transcriptional regulator [Alphaproteobacteria bacterium]
MSNPIKAKAEQRFAKSKSQGADVIRERDQSMRDLTTKSEKLRALRLAKEAEERAAKEQAKAEKAKK